MSFGARIQADCGPRGSWARATLSAEQGTRCVPARGCKHPGLLRSFPVPSCRRATGQPFQRPGGSIVGRKVRASAGLASPTHQGSVDSGPRGDGRLTGNPYTALETPDVVPGAVCPSRGRHSPSPARPSHVPKGIYHDHHDPDRRRPTAGVGRCRLRRRSASSASAAPHFDPVRLTSDTVDFGSLGLRQVPSTTRSASVSSSGTPAMGPSPRA